MEREWKILSRFRDFHKKAKNILENSARKIGKWIVEMDKLFNVSAIYLEDLNNLIKSVRSLLIKFRDKLYLMEYHRIQYWIEWEAKKHGLKVVYVDAYSSSRCPKCGNEMEEVGYRNFHCVKCGYENDRDVIAILYGSLTLSTASHMRDVSSNR
ncbi:hypothetical protein BFU36_12815 [Sulfolobus sp. A20]|uniref:zinc ribbon domain-containing protein n=1 Tax=Saccharolobus sp. A20 TaxID=1891280 RepID=UPI0008460A7C|nr:zinc ribbon domain-containing protein [Sulfolobus sp. A20]AOL17448.1 hypothetical protein BFU36_12815 [Sulfolobus sp. A20]